MQMAIREKLRVPAQVKWGIMGNSLLNKSFSDSQALSCKISLASLFQFWKWAKFWPFNISYGGNSFGASGTLMQQCHPARLPFLHMLDDSTYISAFSCWYFVCLTKMLWAAALYMTSKGHLPPEGAGKTSNYSYHLDFHSYIIQYLIFKGSLRP